MSDPIHLDFRCRRCGSMTERIREEHSEGLGGERQETVYHACHDGGIGLAELVGFHMPSGLATEPPKQG